MSYGFFASHIPNAAGNQRYFRQHAEHQLPAIHTPFPFSVA